MITTDSLLTTLVFIAAISTGLVAGIFFAFSSFVMSMRLSLPGRFFRRIQFDRLNPLRCQG